MMVTCYNRREPIRQHSRASANGSQPSRGLAPDTTGTSFASQTGLAGTAMGASFRTPATGTQNFNRANLLSFQGKCDTIAYHQQYATGVLGNPGFGFGCSYDYGGAPTPIPPGRGTTDVGR